MKSNSFIPLYVTNFFGTLNDNFLKTLASFTMIGWLADDAKKDGYRKTSFLWRLFRYESDPGKGKKVDLLFIPVWR